MRKLILPAALLLLVAIAVPVIAQEEEVDIGLTFMPAAEDVFLDSGLLGLHLGYRFSHILYGTWDAIIVPPQMVQSWTSAETTVGTETIVIPGTYRPGFLNLIDFGLGLKLGPFFGSAQAGVNYLYILEQSDLPPEQRGGGVGANVRLGAALRFDYWAVVLNGTVAFPSLQSAFQTIADLGKTGPRGEAAREIFIDYMLYSVGFLLYL